MNFEIGIEMTYRGPTPGPSAGGEQYGVKIKVFPLPGRGLRGGFGNDENDEK